jgi:hypothetical protein
MSRWQIKRVYRQGPELPWRDPEEFILDYDNLLDPNFMIPGDDRLMSMTVMRLPDAED